MDIAEILAAFREGTLSEADAEAAIAGRFFQTLGHSTLDTDRSRRTGAHEVIYGEHKTPAQIALRWFIELGIVAIPRSSNPGRLRQNIDIFDFTLTDAEVTAISALDTGEEKRVDSDITGH